MAEQEGRPTRKSRVSIMETKGSERKIPGNLSVPALSSQSVAGIGRNKSSSRIKCRRSSFGFSSVPGIRPIERTSQLGMEFRRPILTYLPTYQIEPKVKFNNFVVNKIIEKELDDQFTGHIYNAQASPALALKLAGDLMRATKPLFNRYRIIAVVTVGQKRAQSYNNAIAFIWDFERDSYVDSHRENSTAFIQATVFGIYLD